MEFFRIKRDIPFMKHALVFNVISVAHLRRGGVLPGHEGPAPVDRVHRRHGDRGASTRRRPTSKKIRAHRRSGWASASIAGARTSAPRATS